MVVNNSVVLVAVETASAYTALVALSPFDERCSQTVITAHSGSVRPTAIHFESTFSMIYVALSPLLVSGLGPSTIYKISFPDTSLLGSVQLGSVTLPGGVIVPEVVCSMVSDSQSLLAVLDSPQLRVVRCFLCSIHEVFPSVVDWAGGTPVVVRGDGFVQGKAFCKWRGIILFNATVTSVRELTCVVPPSGDVVEWTGVHLAVGFSPKGPFTTQSVYVRQVCCNIPARGS